MIKNIPFSVLCFDLDGTLVNDQGKIHPNDVVLLNHPHSAVLFIPATGRPLESVRRTFQKVGLFKEKNIPFPLVLQNGSLLYLPDEIQVSYRPFDMEVQKRLIDLAKDRPEITFLFLGAKEIHLLWPSQFGLASVEKYEFEVVPFTDRSMNCSFSKVMCISNVARDLSALAQLVKWMSVDTALSTPTIFEITPQGINKGSGLLKLLRALGWENLPLYVAGDGENDLPVMQMARVSFAPTNALPDVIKQSHFRIDVGQRGLLRPMIEKALTGSQSL